MGRRVSNIELSRFRGWRGRNDSGRDAREERTPRDHGSETSTAGLATGLRKECWYLCWSKIFCMRGQGRQQQFGAQQNRAWGTRPAAAGQIMRARPAAAVEGQQRPPSCLIEGRATLAEERVKPWWRRLVGQAKMGAAAALLWRRRLAMSGGVAPKNCWACPGWPSWMGTSGRLGRTKGGRWVRRHAAQTRHSPRTWGDISRQSTPSICV
jgi:hypothetical protein